MDLKLGASIHNRFDIRVIRDGRVIQEAQAENIILDRMYTRICAFSKYFDYIHFGTGTGTQSASRTTLFTATSYKSATTVETIYAFPTSKVTKKIQLNPSEYIGSVFTEVGISESTSNINTHALIKDAEGNQISITKTALDLVEIYATVYIELVDTDIVVFNRPASGNALLTYFIAQTAPTYTIRSYVDNVASLAAYGGSTDKATTLTSNSTNKTTTWATVRYEVSDGNTGIYKLGAAGICFTSVPNVATFNGMDMTKTFTGDGSTTLFDLPYPSSNVSVTIDGVATTDYTYLTQKSRYHYASSYTPNGSWHGNMVSSSLGFRWYYNWSSVETLYKSLYRVILNNGGCWDQIADIGGAPNLQPIGAEGNTIFYKGFNDSGNNIVYLYTYTEETNSVAYSGISCNIGTYRPTSVSLSSGGSYLVLWVLNTSGATLSRWYTLSGQSYINGTDLPHYYTSGIWVSDALYIGYSTTAYFKMDMSTASEIAYYTSLHVFIDKYNNKTHLFTKSYAVSPYNVTHTTFDSNGTLESTESFASPGASYYLVAYNFDCEIAYFCMTDSSGALYAYGKVGEGVYRSLGLVSSESAYGIGGVLFYNRFTFYLGNNTFQSNSYGHSIIKCLTDLKTLKFNTPPASGAVITASYHTDCIPKSTDYVLDVGFTLQFGEGTI